MHIRCIILQLISTALVTGVSCASEPVIRIGTNHHAMGMEFHFVVYSSDDALARAACRIAGARINEIEDSLSDYIYESELMRLSREAVEKPAKVSEDLYKVLAESLKMSTLSEGAFDITVGPYSVLWRQARFSRRLPDPEAIRSSAARVGFRMVTLDKEEKTIQLARSQMRFDPGGVAKGFALDEAFRIFQSKGLKQVLVRAGGDLVAGEPPPGRKGWILSDKMVGRQMMLSACAVATSGDASQGIDMNGVRYSHIIDPRTGYGLTNRCESIVIAAHAIDADMRASTLCVLGMKEGMKLARAQKWAARISTLDENGDHSSVATEGFKRYNYKPE